MQGTLFLVVGPSGVGKDSLLDGARKKLVSYRWVSFPQRIITRPVDAGVEPHISVTELEFDNLLTNGSMWHHWEAHGLRYGIPNTVLANLENGINVILNTSRNELKAFRNKADNVVTIFISASPSIVEQRLRNRGRETEGEIQKRLSRIVDEPSRTCTTFVIQNDASLCDGTEMLVDLIAGNCNLQSEVKKFSVEIDNKKICLIHVANPVARLLLAGSIRVTLSFEGKCVTAELGWTSDEKIATENQCALSGGAISTLGLKKGDVAHIRRSPNPKSRSILQKKISGAELTYSEMEALFSDLVSGRYSQSEIAGFLVAASTNLSMDEIIALTHVRAQFEFRQTWGDNIVVDKHSMGGIPGNRITPIVIPIIAAFGLKIPKTSSRAITSAAGTADMMEVLARIDLSPEEMKHVVEQANACIVWNGRLTHTLIDEVMNKINCQLGLSSALLDVTSIMSKKLAAGSSHVLIDMPVGPRAKTKSRSEAIALKVLFENAGNGVGLNTRVSISDGTKPIGHGVGPILETLDVFAVLSNAQEAPMDLRSKSIDYAAQILEWVGAVPERHGKSIAEDLITSGKAMEKLLEIADLQGRQNPHALQPGKFSHVICAERSGIINSINIQGISETARSAGAPSDKAAGVVVLADVGQDVVANDPLVKLHSSSSLGLEKAISAFRKRDPFGYEVGSS